MEEVWGTTPPCIMCTKPLSCHPSQLNQTFIVLRLDQTLKNKFQKSNGGSMGTTPPPCIMCIKPLSCHPSPLNQTFILYSRKKYYKISKKNSEEEKVLHYITLHKKIKVKLEDILRIPKSNFNQKLG